MDRETAKTRIREIISEGARQAAPTVIVQHLVVWGDTHIHLDATTTLPATRPRLFHRLSGRLRR